MCALLLSFCLFCEIEMEKKNSMQVKCIKANIDKILTAAEEP